MGVTSATHEIASLSNQCDHIFNRQDRADFIGGENKDDIAFRRRDAGTNGINDPIPERVLDAAQLGIDLMDIVDDRDAVIVCGIVNDQHFVRQVHDGAKNLEHNAQIDAFIAHGEQNRQHPAAVRRRCRL